MAASKFITQAAFAETMGVDRAQVTRWIAKGMPVERNGVDPAAAAAWVRASIDPAQRNRRSRGAEEVRLGNDQRRAEAFDQSMRTALRLMAHLVPDVARSAALDAGLSAEQAEAVMDAACVRIMEVEAPLHDALDIPPGDGAPLSRIELPLMVVPQADGTLSLAPAPERDPSAHA